MSAPPVASPCLMSVEKYLATEPFSPIKREYLAGIVYPMMDPGEAPATGMAKSWTTSTARTPWRSCRR